VIVGRFGTLDGLQGCKQASIKVCIVNCVSVIFLYFIIIVKNLMPKVSSKRQITIPAEYCRALNIEPGDVVEFFVSKGGWLTLVKKELNAAAGSLSHVRARPGSTEQDSRQDPLK